MVTRVFVGVKDLFMQIIRRPRFWIALLLGLVAAQFVTLVPPRPSDAFSVATVKDDDQTRIRLRDVSSDGRFVITGEANQVALWQPDEMISVWDRHGKEPKPIYTLTVNVNELDGAFLSPDENVLCVIIDRPSKLIEKEDGRLGYVLSPRPVRLYDLPSGRKLKELQSTALTPFFGADGKLLTVENGVLRDVETGAELKRVPTEIDGFKYSHTIGAFALYSREAKTNQLDMRLYPVLTGELRASATLPAAQVITQICADGLVWCWTPRSWQNVAVREPFPSQIRDTESGQCLDIRQIDQFARASPDGEIFAYRAEAPPLHRWLQWLPLRQGWTMRVLHWKTHEELATFPDAKELRFSADGSKLAVLRDVDIIEIYDFPFRTPWGLIAGAAVLTAAFTWSLGWMWSRFRKPGQITSPAPDSHPR